MRKARYPSRPKQDSGPQTPTRAGAGTVIIPASRSKIKEDLQIMEYKLVPATAKSRMITLQEVVTAAAQHGRATIPIVGNCMEGAEILDGGSVDVDFTHYPRIGDPCVCYASFPGKGMEPAHPPTVMCKTYDGVWSGHMVGIRYMWTGGKGRINCGFSAKQDTRRMRFPLAPAAGGVAAVASLLPIPYPGPLL